MTWPPSVSSAGFLYDGHPASDTATKVMRERGLDLRAHRSRILDRRTVDEADVVLTMSGAARATRWWPSTASSGPAR